MSDTWGFDSFRLRRNKLRKKHKTTKYIESSNIERGLIQQHKEGDNIYAYVVDPTTFEQFWVYSSLDYLYIRSPGEAFENIEAFKCNVLVTRVKERNYGI